MKEKIGIILNLSFRNSTPRHIVGISLAFSLFLTQTVQIVYLNNMFPTNKNGTSHERLTVNGLAMEFLSGWPSFVPSPVLFLSSFSLIDASELFRSATKTDNHSYTFNGFLWCAGFNLSGDQKGHIEQSNNSHPVILRCKITLQYTVPHTRVILYKSKDKQIRTFLHDATQSRSSRYFP